MVDHLSEDELIKLIDHAKSLVEVGATYSHYRNPKNQYIVTGLTVIDATQKNWSCISQKNRLKSASGGDLGSPSRVLDRTNIRQ